MDNPNSNCTLLGVRGSPFMAHSQKRKQYSIQDIYMDYCVYLALTIYNISNGDASINGWYIMFCFGFAIVSLPAFVLMTIICAKISQITNRIKAVWLVMLTALPLVVINFMGSNLGIGKEDMIKDVAHEIIVTILKISLGYGIVILSE